MTPKASGLGLTNENTLALIKGGKCPETIAEAFTNGTNIRAALRLDKRATKAYLLKELGLTLQMVDAGTTIQDAAELRYVLDALIDEFPAFTLEEFRLCFEKIRRGKAGEMYNRLKLPELVKVCQRHEGERAHYLEATHRRPDQFDRFADGEPKRVALMITPEELKEIYSKQTAPPIIEKQQAPE